MKKNVTLSKEKIDNCFNRIKRKDFENIDKINKTFTHVKDFKDIIIITKTNNKVNFPQKYIKEFKGIKNDLIHIKFNKFKLFGCFKDEIFYVILMKIDDSFIDVNPTKEFFKKLQLEKIKTYNFEEEFGYNNVCIPYWFLNDKDEKELYLIERS